MRFVARAIASCSTTVFGFAEAVATSPSPVSPICPRLILLTAVLACRRAALFCTFLLIRSRPFTIQAGLCSSSPRRPASRFDSCPSRTDG